MEYENSTKKHIRNVALKLFKEKSFENVTLKEICEASGVNKHTFYYYFKSKDELLNQYYKIPCKLTSYDLATIMTAESYVEQLWLLNKNFVDFIADSGVSIIKQIIIKNLTDNHIGTFKVTEDFKQLLKLQYDIIKKGQDNGEILNKSEPEDLVLLLRQTIHSTAATWSIKNGNFDYREVTRFFFETILDVAPSYRKMNNTNLRDIF